MRCKSQADSKKRGQFHFLLLFTEPRAVSGHLFQRYVSWLFMWGKKHLKVRLGNTLRYVAGKRQKQRWKQSLRHRTTKQSLFWSLWSYKSLCVCVCVCVYVPIERQRKTFKTTPRLELFIRDCHFIYLAMCRKSTPFRISLNRSQLSLSLSLACFKRSVHDQGHFQTNAVTMKAHVTLKTTKQFL